LSLYRDESQLQKPKGVKRKRSTPPKPKSPKKPKKATKQITEKTKTVKSKIKVKKAVDKKVVEAPVQTVTLHICVYIITAPTLSHEIINFSAFG